VKYIQIDALKLMQFLIDKEFREVYFAIFFRRGTATIALRGLGRMGDRREAGGTSGFQLTFVATSHLLLETTNVFSKYISLVSALLLAISL
jgi:hypothetical protein